MDPDANVAEQVVLAKRIIMQTADLADLQRLAELVLALVEWRAQGGFSPSYALFQGADNV